MFSVIAIGSALIVIGLLTLFAGDKELPMKGGIILRMFSWPGGRARWIKWPVGIVLIYAGVAIIYQVLSAS